MHDTEDLHCNHEDDCCRAHVGLACDTPKASPNTDAADEAYKAALGNGREIVRSLETLMSMHAVRYTENRGDWGLVGDMNETARILGEVRDFLRGGAR